MGRVCWVGSGGSEVEREVVKCRDVPRWQMVGRGREGEGGVGEGDEREEGEEGGWLHGGGARIWSALGMVEEIGRADGWCFEVLVPQECLAEIFASLPQVRSSYDV